MRKKQPAVLKNEKINRKEYNQENNLKTDTLTGEKKSITGLELKLYSEQPL
jgi:hypothetical protein